MSSDHTLLPTADGRRVWRTCLELLRGRWWLLLGVAACFIVAAAAALVLPTSLGKVVDIVADGGGQPAQIWRLGGWMALGALVEAVASGLGMLASAAVVERLLAKLREDLVSTALRLPRRVIERTGTGDLVSRASDDVAQVAEGLPLTLPTVAASGFTLALTAVALAVLNPWFALVAVVVAPVHVLAVRWYLRTAPAIYTAERVALGERAHHVLAALRALPTVQAFGLAAVHALRIGAASWQVVHWSLRARAVQNTFFARLNFAEFLGMSTILVVSFVLVSRGSITVGAATTAMLLFLQLFGPMNAMLIVIDGLQSALASLSRIVGVRDMDTPADDVRHTSGGGAAALELRQVSFGYGEHEVLHTVDLRVPPGQRVALVGSSGAGKSTLAGLAAGIHEPWAGQVRVSDAAGQRTVLISQEVHVFAGTVRDNLTLAAPEADDAALTTALSAVGGWGMVAALPEGLDTEVGPSARTLTVAQAQLIALARVHLADPALVLLDEATAEAGSAQGGQLDRAARAVMAGRSGLVIAHRLDQAVDADQIVVMAHGRVVERGRHEELVAAGGTYADLWAAWTRNRP